MTDTPLTDEQLTQIEAIAARVADDPFYVSDCEGSLQVWREKALTHVRRDEDGVIEMYSFPSSYRVTDQVIELDLNTWDPGEDESDDKQRQDIYDLVESRAAVPALVDKIRRLQARVAELEDPAVEARAALAALCYDLEDPGSNALGALYLLQQATLTVDAPKDDTSAALLRHACKVLHGVADIADPEPPEVSFFGATFGPQVAAWLRMLADRRPAAVPAVSAAGDTGSLT